MSRFWTSYFVIVHACLAVLLIVSEEFYHWDEYDFWQLQEQTFHRPFSPVSGKSMQDAISIDHFPDARERTFHTLNLPASALFGWYSHPISISANSAFGPRLLYLSQHTTVKSRIVMLDGLLLSGVCLQWSLIVLWLKRQPPLAQGFRVIAVSMTILGTFMTLVAVPKRLASGNWIEGAITVSSIAVVLGWALLIVTASVCIFISGARILVRNKHKAALI